MEDIKVLAFNTGGTVLDWHAGLTAAFAAWGAAQGIERDWHALRTSIAASHLTPRWRERASSPRSPVAKG